MFGENQSARAAELINNVQQSRGQVDDGRHPRIVQMLALVTGIMFAIILILAFAVIIARQHTIDALRNQVDRLAEQSATIAANEADLAECRTLMANNISEAQQSADNALNDLVVLISRQIISSIPPNRDVFHRATDRLESTNGLAGIAVRQRTEWLADGSALPCPIEP